MTRLSSAHVRERENEAGSVKAEDAFVAEDERKKRDKKKRGREEELKILNIETEILNYSSPCVCIT